jgi:hypothetical protein
LLQLSLLHREVGAVTREWHESAKKKIGKRFRDAATEHEGICVGERDGIEKRNVAALLGWCSRDARGDAGALGLAEKLQSLGQVLDGVWAFSEPGGRYSRVVEAFDVWARQMTDIMAMRKRGHADELVRETEVLFVSDLDARWKDECPGLARKLEAWRRMLEEMGSAPDEPDEGPKSSLPRVLEGCASLVTDMLTELEIMQEMEKESRRTEDDWIEMMNVELKIGDHEAMDRETPLWKLMI